MNLAKKFSVALGSSHRHCEHLHGESSWVSGSELITPPSLNLKKPVAFGCALLLEGVGRKTCGEVTELDEITFLIAR